MLERQRQRRGHSRLQADYSLTRWALPPSLAHRAYHNLPGDFTFEPLP